MRAPIEPFPGFSGFNRDGDRGSVSALGGSDLDGSSSRAVTTRKLELLSGTAFRSEIAISRIICFWLGDSFAVGLRGDGDIGVLLASEALHYVPLLCEEIKVTTLYLGLVAFNNLVTSWSVYCASDGAAAFKILPVNLISSTPSGRM